MGISFGIDPSDYDWYELDRNISFYAKSDVKKTGLSLTIDIDIYQHNLDSNKPICKDMFRLSENEISRGLF